ncbi:MAG: hypothetical protein PHP08_04745 [Candidatus Dojkabacteria bacterium]|nr:hypothetical protein [Candidatus Dojkabacteria bacterium]
MDNILRDGTQIDQTVFKDLDLNLTASPAVSDFIIVPALYTGNLHIELMSKTQCTIHGEVLTLEDEETTVEIEPYVDIEYFDREKNFLFRLKKYINIPIGIYSAGTIMSEFSLPFKFLKNIENGNKVSHIKIKLNYVNDTSSGKLNAYLIWR